MTNSYEYPDENETLVLDFMSSKQRFLSKYIALRRKPGRVGGGLCMTNFVNHVPFFGFV